MTTTWTRWIAIAALTLGVITALPVAVRPIASLVGAPLRLRGLGLDCARFSPTKIVPSRCSTDQQAIGLNAGARKASPVRRSKQA